MNAIRPKIAALHGRLRDFASARNGNIALMFAITLPLIVGGLGYGVETSYWYLLRNRMQGATDAAAHAAAMEARMGSDYVTVKAAAVRAAADNGFSNAAGVAVSTPPTTGPAAGKNNAVEVVLQSSVGRVFTAVFIANDLTLETRAVSTFNSASTACILALDPTASQAADFGGNTDVTLDGCSVMANSNAANAINVQGSAELTTDCAIAVGSVAVGATLTLTDCDEPVTYAVPVADPFRNIPVPARPLSCLNDNGATLSPGLYCNGMALKNNKTLQPGVYYIEGGNLQINANADVQGTGVTIYLASGVHLDFNGNARIRLSAPTSGTYSGMLFFGDRATAGTNKVNGTADSLLTGAIYFKNQSVDYLGNFSGQGGCTQVVAKTIQWSGSTQIAANCTALGMTPIPAMMVVKLTE
jgi:Flp pilus assembly protein TadG